MKLHIDNALQGYRYSCQKLANEFRDKYFSKYTEIDWVSDDVTGVAIIGDYYFSINTIYEYLYYKYTKEQIFKRYNAELDNSMLKKPESFPNIKTWKLLYKFANKNKKDTFYWENRSKKRKISNKLVCLVSSKSKTI